MTKINSDTKDLSPLVAIPGPLGWSEMDFLQNRFIPTTVYVLESDTFHSRLCIYNYFSEILPDVKTGVKVNIWVFDSTGTPLASFQFPLGYRGQVQFEMSQVGKFFEGTAAVSMVPDTLPTIKHPNNVGTGYYAYYYDNHGHTDFSHEWSALSFKPSKGPPWICLVRPKLFPDTQIIFMAGYYGQDLKEGACEFTIRLRNGKGKILENKAMNLRQRAVARLSLSKLFNRLSTHVDKEDTLSVEVVGNNMHGPFTWVTHTSGDFNIHHFP